MNRKTLAYSGILLIALVISSILLDRGVLQSAITSSEVTLTPATQSVSLGGQATLTGSIVIGTDTESIDEVTIEIATSTANFPNFKLRVQPKNGTTTIVKTFNATTTAAADSSSDGLLNSTSIFGDNNIKVTIDLTIFNTTPGTIPSTLPGSFKGPSSTSAIGYTILWNNDPCQDGATTTPCTAGNTVEGSYTATFAVKQGGTTISTSTTITLVTVASPTVSITSPTANQGLSSSDLDSDGKATVTGTVDDGGIAAVTSGGTLSSAALVGSPASAPVAAFTLETSADTSAVTTSGAADTTWLLEAGSGSLWHVTDEIPPFFPSGGKPFTGTTGFAYTKDPDSPSSSNAFNYDTLNTKNSGGLLSPKFTVGSGSVLKFDTWHDTEFGTFYDQKIVQWCPGATFSASACETIVQITSDDPAGFFDPFAFFFDPFGGTGPGGPPAGSEPGSTFDGSVIGFPGVTMMFIPNFNNKNGVPTPVSVELDLFDILSSSSTFSASAVGRIRFFFDTIDGFGNFQLGWYVDTIVVEGEGTITAASFPVGDDLTWTGKVLAVDGQNVVNITGQRTLYLLSGESTGPTASTTVTFFLDTIAPAALAIDTPDLTSVQVANPTTAFVTGGATVELTGSFTEAQPSTLAITRQLSTSTGAVTTAQLNTDFAASDVKTLFTLKDSNNEFDSAGSTTLSKDVRPGSAVSTTLASAAVAGDTTITIASAAGLAQFDIVKIDTKSSKEFKTITQLSGTTLTLDSALGAAHAAGVAVDKQFFIVVATSDFTDFPADKFIRIDKGPNAEVRRITATSGLDNKNRIAFATALSKSHGSGTEVKGAEDRTFRTSSGSPLSLEAGYNKLTVTLTDKAGVTATSTVIIVRDNTAPTGTATIVTITSESEAVVGDQFFLLVAASDAESAVSSVKDSSGNALATVGSVERILLDMHDLTKVVNTSTTHIRLSSVSSGTPVGENDISITLEDGAGNTATITAQLQVVPKRTNRNFFLFPDINFIGLSLIPDDQDSSTPANRVVQGSDANPATADDSLDRLMAQDITARVNSTFVSGHTHVGHSTSGLVTLGDVVASTFAFSGGSSGTFLVHTPGPAADTLLIMEPFQGMIMKTNANPVINSQTVDIFKLVGVTGFTAQQSVPVRFNIKGLFFKTGAVTPPQKTLAAGYNLVAPHILADTTFDLVYRGALVPNQLAVSAITFERRVDATQGTAKVDAEIFEGSTVDSLGDLLKPTLSYWTFIVSGTPIITP